MQVEMRQIAMRKVGELRGYERNSRKHSPEQIAKVVSSIREFGWTNPILVNGEGVIVAGHARMEAAKVLGLAEVPTIELSGMTLEQLRAYVIADNALALDASWDLEVLAGELEALKGMGVGVELTGLEPGEIEHLLSPLAGGLDAGEPGGGNSSGTGKGGGGEGAGAVEKEKCPKCGFEWPKVKP